MTRLRRWLVSATVGIVAGVTVALAWPDPHPQPDDPLAVIPPADSSTEAVVEGFASSPVYVDPDLGHLLPDEQRIDLVERIEEFDLPAYVAVVRTGSDDGFGSFLPPRIIRIAADVGTDGVYIAVDQSRSAAAAYVHDGEVIDDRYVYPDDGSLGPALQTWVDAIHDDDDLYGYRRTVENADQRTATPTAGSIAGGAVVGVLAAATAYGVLMVIVGVVRTTRGLPFRPPRATEVTAARQQPRSAPTGRRNDRVSTKGSRR